MSTLFRLEININSVWLLNGLGILRLFIVDRPQYDVHIEYTGKASPTANSRGVSRRYAHTTPSPETRAAEHAALS